MNIKCAHCKGRHDTVIAVKECFLGSVASKNTPKHTSAPPAAVAFVPTQPVTEPGMYRKLTSVYRVRRSKTGNLYAEALVAAVPGQKKGRYVYAPGAIKALTADMKMTLVQAKEYGQEFGTCCVCGALLTDPKSVTAGIGPVCVKKF